MALLGQLTLSLFASWYRGALLHWWDDSAMSLVLDIWKSGIDVEMMGCLPAAPKDL